MTHTNLIFRRVHLYLGMLLIPWVVVYASSTFVFNHHRQLFKGYFTPEARAWTTIWEKEQHLDVPKDRAKMRELARKILDQNGMGGSFGVNQNPRQMNISLPDFQTPRRVVYHKKEGLLVAQEQGHTWPMLLVRLHVRTGYGREGMLHDGWAFFVDLVCLAILMWVFTGIYLWWKIPSTRKWGFISLGAGAASFLVLLLTM